MMHPSIFGLSCSAVRLWTSANETYVVHPAINLMTVDELVVASGSAKEQ